MIGTAVAFVLLELLPVNFPYWLFALLLFFTGLVMASFGSPNRAAVMNSLPPEHRGAGSGMNTTFQNSAQVLSIGIFFSLMIVGLSSSLPQSLYQGLVAHGVSPAAATARLAPAAGLHAVRRVPWLQPGPASRRARGAVPPDRRPAGDADRPEFLPHADHRAVQGRAAGDLRLRHRGEPGGRGGLVDPGREGRHRGRRTAAPLPAVPDRSTPRQHGRRRRRTGQAARIRRRLADGRQEGGDAGQTGAVAHRRGGQADRRHHPDAALLGRARAAPAGQPHRRRRAAVRAGRRAPGDQNPRPAGTPGLFPGRGQGRAEHRGR